MLHHWRVRVIRSAPRLMTFQCARAMEFQPFGKLEPSRAEIPDERVRSSNSCGSCPAAARGSDWSLELKLDGYRVICRRLSATVVQGPQKLRLIKAAG